MLTLVFSADRMWAVSCKEGKLNLTDHPTLKVYGDWVIDLSWYESQMEIANSYGADVFVHLKDNEVCGLADNDWRCRVCKTLVPDQMKMIIKLHHAKL